MKVLVKRYNFEHGYPVSDDDFVFWRTYHNKDSWATHSSVDNMIRKLCSICDMPNKSAHDLRRTFATNASYAGVATKTIQGWMGHESISQTEAYICTKLNDRHEFEDIEKLAQFSSKRKQKGSTFMDSITDGRKAENL